jgi:hypothetical protein
MLQLLPPWMPAVGIEGGRINIVPVDFVVDAIDHIAHQKEGNKKAFHLVDPTPYRVGDILNIFAKAAHAPQFSLRVNAALVGFIPNSVKKGLLSLTPVRRIKNAVMKDIGVPDDILTFSTTPLASTRQTTALKGSGVACPASMTTRTGCGTTERNLVRTSSSTARAEGPVQGRSCW